MRRWFTDQPANLWWRQTLRHAPVRAALFPIHLAQSRLPVVLQTCALTNWSCPLSWVIPNANKLTNMVRTLNWPLRRCQLWYVNGCLATRVWPEVRWSACFRRHQASLPADRQWCVQSQPSIRTRCDAVNPIMTSMVNEAMRFKQKHCVCMRTCALRTGAFK